MKKINIVILLFVFCSCKHDFLDRPPLDQIGTGSYWKTTKDLENYIIQFYPKFPSHLTHMYGFNYPVRNSDEIIEATPSVILNGDRGVTGGRWTGDWSDIRSVNIFLDNYQKCEESFDTYKHFLGEAYFSCLVYFNLIKKYGDVPWFLQSCCQRQERKATPVREHG